jgi:hypothetical protein
VTHRDAFSLDQLFLDEGGSIVVEAGVSPLLAWANFYVIIGSSAGTLTGLMFLVVTLLAGRTRTPSGTAPALPIAAFNTPTVVHLGVAIFVAALLSAPWQTLAIAAVLLGLTGVGGVGYTLIVLRRTRHQTDYAPVLEDWLWHVLLPLLAYTVLVVAALVLARSPVPTLFAVGAGVVLILFIGIHNAWDNVTYLVTEYLPRARQEKDT